MNKSKIWIRGTLIAAAAAVLVWLALHLGASQPPAAAPPLVSNGTPAGTSVAQAPEFPPAPWMVPPAAPEAAPDASPLSTMTPPQFAADSRGRLVLNADTHANLEKLLIDDNPDTMRATLERSAHALPPQAAAELRVMAAKFQQYSKALSHVIVPDQEPANEQEAVKLLDSLHSLRVSYLGEEATKAMFGDEEASTRQMLAHMQAEKDPNLTLQQKAERAQELLNSNRIKGTPAG